MGGMKHQRRLLLLLAISFALAAANGYRWYLSSGRYVSWAESYTDSGFQSVRAGMSRDEVYALIGHPLSVDEKVGQETGVVSRLEHWSTGSGDLRRDLHFKGDVVIYKNGAMFDGL
jgi:hypothetical protein